MSKTTIPTGGITADAIDATLIADDAISEEHLDATAITGHTALAEAPASTDELLISDAGTLKRIDFSHLKSGGLVFIQQQSVTSNTNTINFNDAFSSTYDNYLFIFDATMGTNAAQLELRFRSGSPTNDNYTGSGTYRYAFTGGDSTGGSVSQSSNSNNKWTMGDGTYVHTSIDPPGVHGFIHFNSPIASSTQRTWSGIVVCYNNNDEQRAFSGGGRAVNNTVMTGFGFTASSGDINQFNGRLYGVVNS